MRTITTVITLMAGLTGAAAAFADELPTPTGAPFAISLGITFSDSAESSLPLDTIAASVATGGTTVITNATAAITDTASSTSSTGTASVSDLLKSDVTSNGSGFISNVGTGFQLPG